LAIAYTRQHGMAMDRFQRPDIAWYGDMELPGHAWRLLAGGPLDVKIRIGEPLSLAEFANRKALARYGEARIRADVADMLRNRAQG
jgi:1-acyl-sn-glycerol-3-phosphate acyltransferase